jgi:cold shock CspA family protein/ribosome-associated translation inhibitor RaiA
MPLSLQVTFHNLEHSEGVETLIRQKAARLEEFYGGLLGCRVAVEVPHRHHRRGNSYRITISLTVPGGEVVVHHEPPRHAPVLNLAAAVRDAFDAARRRLEDHVRVRRRFVKAHDEAPHARVGKLFPAEGYGYLETQEGREVYFHRHSVLGDGFDRLAVGSEVTYAEGSGEQGPQASIVRLVGRHGRR